MWAYRSKKKPFGDIRRKYMMPGKASGTILAIMIAMACFDSVAWLPHPPVAIPIGVPPSPGEIRPELREKFATPQIRNKYKARLASWAKRAAKYWKNITLAELDLGSAWKQSAKTTSGNMCALAMVSVSERESARVEARLHGSAGLHWVLLIRDFWTYQSLNPFTFEAMKKHTIKKNGKISDEDVCNAMVESSTRSNPAWDATAAKRAEHEHTYCTETLTLYIGPSLSIFLLVYFVERTLMFARDPQKNS